MAPYSLYSALLLTSARLGPQRVYGDFVTHTSITFNRLTGVSRAQRGARDFTLLLSPAFLNQGVY